MNLQILIVLFLTLALAVMAVAGEPRNRSTGFDVTGHFTVETDVPAGARHAVLEISDHLSVDTVWRPMIAQATDGREARVLFRLPPQPGGKLFARVKTDAAATLPPVELTGEDLCFVSYGDRIEESARLAFFADASDKLREWKTLPIAQWQSNLVAWALQNPNVATARPSTLTGDIMVRFKDGVDAALLRPARRYTGPSAPPDAPHSVKIRRSARRSAFDAVAPKMTSQPGENLPGTNAAITAFSLESTFPNSAPTIGGWLSANNYDVTHFPSTTVDQIAAWSSARPIGVLFWQSHGAPYELGNGKEGIGLVTRQLAPDYLIKGRYFPLVKAGELKFAIDDNPWKLPYFTIPAKFVRKYLRFAPNSIVVVDACFDHPDNPGHILKPSIMRVIHENAYPGEPYTKFLIEGDFGADPGEALREVTWGGRRMQVVRWDTHKGVTIRMPSSPPAGNIEVVMKKNFTTRSNAVPITEWTVPFTYEVNSHGSLHAKLVMNTKFRADIRGSRGNPEMPVQYLHTHFGNMADCTGTVTASGAHSPSPGTTITWSGGSTLTSVDPNADGTYAPRRVRCNGTLHFGNGFVNPLQLLADGDFAETEVRTNSNGSTTTIERRNGIAFPGFYPQPQMPLNWVTAAFQGNTITWPGTGMKVSWPSVTPRMAPDANTPR